jgi:CheY-like chemotaxis protein
MIEDSIDHTTPDEIVREHTEEEPYPAHPASSYVLVVDDESTVRDFLRRCVQYLGYSVMDAGSAAEALDMMVAKPASVVLCDIRMPDHDGLWLAERLRALWPHTAVVMSTGIDDVQTVNQSHDLGAVGYITKPIDREQLKQVLRRAMMISDKGRLESADSTLPLWEPQAPLEMKTEAEYTLESPVRCPVCGERITSVKAVRLVRTQVNFISALPRRGRVIVCSNCLAVIPAELTNF